MNLDTIEGLKEQVDYFYEKLRPSKNLECFLFWYEKYIRLLIKNEMEDKDEDKQNLGYAK